MPSHIGDVAGNVRMLCELRCESCGITSKSAGLGAFSDRQSKKARKGKLWAVTCRSCAVQAVRQAKLAARRFEGRPAIVRATVALALQDLGTIRSAVEEFLQPPAPLVEEVDSFRCLACERKFLRLTSAIEHWQNRHRP
mmetsp:Transcript_21445/g.49935  ORF Transcript_21445/g.49935 Transcript_21445/m.49935 type:complete len:139 (+) Transcript_21445:51-467(+)